MIAAFRTRPAIGRGIGIRRGIGDGRIRQQILVHEANDRAGWNLGLQHRTQSETGKAATAPKRRIEIKAVGRRRGCVAADLQGDRLKRQGATTIETERIDGAV